MYKISILNVENQYDYIELIKVFLEQSMFEMTDENPDIVANRALSDDKNYIKREIYGILSDLTGKKPTWGILTGVRPVKLTRELFKKLGSYSCKFDLDKTKYLVFKELTETYLLSTEKANLLIDTYLYQRKVLPEENNRSVGLYIGIPFCPTRCVYCSFTSNQKPDSEIKRYLKALYTEIDFVGQNMKEKGLYVESLYIGGGTPTTLNEEELDELLDFVEEKIDLSRCIEYTVEAGRPDTINKEKLEIIKRHNIKRISINPQSMNERTLELIGRSHSPNEILEAYKTAKSVGIDNINCDLITGLPGENLEDFKYTLDEITKLNPENITVHTLAVKRASKLIEEDPNYHYREGEIVSSMLEYAGSKLRSLGYKPYYLYRQKHMAGSFENIGWCKEGTASVYNIRIMDECQHILALGAGGISKVYFPKENRLERVPNVSNYEVYIDRLEEMLDRKKQNFFLPIE